MDQPPRAGHSQPVMRRIVSSWDGFLRWSQIRVSWIKSGVPYRERRLWSRLGDLHQSRQLHGEGSVPAATTTSSAGYYALTFPLKDTELGYTYYDLWPNGWCKDNTWPGSAGNVSNSMLTLNVSAPGYWSATEFVSFVNSATNDYQQFGLPSNGVSVSPLSVAFVHTSLLSCGVNITNGVSQGVESSLGELKRLPTPIRPFGGRLPYPTANQRSQRTMIQPEL